MTRVVVVVVDDDVFVVIIVVVVIGLASLYGVFVKGSKRDIYKGVKSAS